MLLERTWLRYYIRDMNQVVN
ncbi:UNVERIFIED_CONTAM: hypothetical protein GTU68_025530 [Idotea baltica]|nr:hypothetical protein [Idotea baltica]